MTATLVSLFFLFGVLFSWSKSNWPCLAGSFLGFVVLTIVRERTGATLVWKVTYSRRKSILLLAIGVVIILLGLIAMVVVGLEFIGLEFIIGFLAAIAIGVGLFLAIGALLVLGD